MANVIIGLCGYKGSGKDSYCDALKALLGPQAVFQTCFADPMKEFVASVYDWPREVLYGPSELREVPDPRYPRDSSDGGPEFLTPRYALQQLGTEWGRRMFKDTWLNLTMRRCMAAPQRVAVITDVRFINEAETIHKAGGLVIRVMRPGCGPGEHASEQEQEYIRACYVFANEDNPDPKSRVEDMTRAWAHLITQQLSWSPP